MLTLQKFQRCVKLASLSRDDKDWLPKWLSSYAKFHGIHAQDVELPMDQDRVVAFLRSLRDGKVEAWRRLQATRAMELYQGVVLRTQSADFVLIRSKLTEIAAREKATKGLPVTTDLVPGEGNAGKLSRNSSEPIQKMQARLRLLHHPLSTERSYLGWMKRFVKHLGDRRPEDCGEQEIAEFLTDAAIDGNVTASTQNQGLCALLFYYEKVLGRDLAFINALRARASEYRPLVLSKRETAQLFQHFTGVPRLMFLLMYGVGYGTRNVEPCV